MVCSKAVQVTFTLWRHILSSSHLAWLFLYHFYTLCASCYLIPWKVRSPDQFDWITRLHITFFFFFCKFETESEAWSRWQSALKVAGCNKPTGSYNMYILDFVYQWPKVWSNVDLAIIGRNSMGEKSTGSFFTNTRCNIKLYHGWHHLWPSQTT